MSLKLKWLENIDSLVAGLHKGRAAARIFVCSQQKPRTEQVVSCIFKMLKAFLVFSKCLIAFVSLLIPSTLVCGRNGSFCNTFMAKSDFWSSSLPRSLPRRKVMKLSLQKQSLILKDLLCKYSITWIRWLLTMRLQNGPHLLLRLESSQSTPWRISQEFHKPITRLDSSLCSLFFL